MHLNFYHKGYKEMHKEHKAHFVSFMTELCVVIFAKLLFIQQALNISIFAVFPRAKKEK